MVKEVLQDPNPVLHKKSLPITQNFGGTFLTELILDMKDTLRQQDGLGLAGPQIGESLAIFVIPDAIAPQVRTPKMPFTLIKPLKPTVFINPKIACISPDMETLEEGCLSIKGIFKSTPRSYKVKLKALDERGRKITVTAEGLLARIFQHETDHLNGVLFIDRL